MFCLKHGLVTPATPLLPTKEVTLIYFVSHLAEYVRFHTIKVYLAAIQNLHVEFNCNLNFAVMPRLQNTLRGIKRTLGLSRRNRLPITLFILKSIFKLLTPSHSLDIDTVMLWAAFSLAFFGFLRCSELTCNGQFDRNVHLTREDFAFFPNIVSPQHMKVRIKKSKTDPFRQTSTITIAGSQSNVCAMAATRDFLLQTPDCSPQSPMFQFKDGAPLSRRTLASNLHTLLELCGFQPNNYNTHSFRIGAATTAAAAGLPAWLIKILGHWRSDSYERYIHLPQATILQVPTTMVAYHQNHTGVENLTTFDPWK